MADNVLQLGEVPLCRMFDLSTKVYGGILPNCCYKLVRIYSTELDLKDETFFFSFLCGGKNKNLKINKMKTRISIDVNDQMSVVELKNADGHTFTFNPNTRQGEELYDFIATCKNHTISEIEEYQKKKIISTLQDLAKIAKRYEKERQGLYEWELPLFNDVRDLLKYLENGNK